MKLFVVSSSSLQDNNLEKLKSRARDITMLFFAVFEYLKFVCLSLQVY